MKPAKDVLKPQNMELDSNRKTSPPIRTHPLSALLRPHRHQGTAVAMLPPPQSQSDLPPPHHDAAAARAPHHRTSNCDLDYYRDDELVKRALGLKRLVSTLSRSLKSADAQCSATCAPSRQRSSSSAWWPNALRASPSTFGAEHSAEGTAVGFNNKKKGARLLPPVLHRRPDRVLDVHHRPGNVHDSNGADAFIERCVRTVREHLPGATLEVRIDSAFFNETIVERLHSLGDLHHLGALRALRRAQGDGRARRRWRPMPGGLAYFESRWKPKCGIRAIASSSSGPGAKQGPHPARPVRARRVRL